MWGNTALSNRAKPIKKILKKDKCWQRLLIEKSKH